MQPEGCKTLEEVLQYLFKHYSMTPEVSIYQMPGQPGYSLSILDSTARS